MIDADAPRQLFEILGGFGKFIERTIVENAQPTLHLPKKCVALVKDRMLVVGDQAASSDAVDGAFATIYGEAKLSYFEVWAYQVNPQQVSVGDPIDLSLRLDGVKAVRLN